MWSQLSGQPLREQPPVTQYDLITYFPQAWHGKDPLPALSFQDIPQDEPELVREILQPWPDRSLMAVGYNKLWDLWLYLSAAKEPITPKSM